MKHLANSARCGTLAATLAAASIGFVGVLGTALTLVVSTASAQTAAPSPVAPSPAAQSPITANISLVTDYRYRGLAQTANKPAIQGGVDYAHESGFYAGNWNSTVSWVTDLKTGLANSVEMDFYAGVKKEVVEGITLDGGLLYYYYPTTGTLTAGSVSPNSMEAYLGATFKMVSVKYSYALTDLFATPNSKGSAYLDVGLNVDTGISGITINLHAGRQTIANTPLGDYTDWKIGATKDLGDGFSIAAAYIGTDAKSSFYTNTVTPELGKAGATLILTKTF